MPSPIDCLYAFGEFTLDSEQRVLLHKGKPVPLTPKVFDTLLILVENKGRLVDKDELMNRLWPDTFVEQTNLTFNIKQLRKSLGDDARNPAYIETVARRGYRFIANVEAVSIESSLELNNAVALYGPGDESPVFAPGESPGSRVEAALSLAGESKRSAPAVDSIGAPVTSPTPNEPVDSLGNSDGHGTHRSASPARNRILFRTALITAIAAAFFIYWKFSSGSGKNSVDRARVARETGSPAPLKLERLTGTGQSRLVTISPDGKYIAYTHARDEKSSIWLRQLATNTNLEIVPAAGIIYGLSFTNSGDSLYFVSGPTMNLSRISVLGGVTTKIVDKIEGNFSLSSDDSQIAFVRKPIGADGEPEYALTIASSNGSSERILLTQKYPVRLDSPLWSPGDQSIICSMGGSQSGSQDVRIVDVRIADGLTRELSSERFFHISKMAWLPHQTGLMLSATKNLADPTQLWRISYPSMQVKQVSVGLDSYLDLSVASGADTAVASQTSRISDIWVGASNEPQNLKKLTQATDNFSWTPDGRLVYSSTAGGQDDIWIMKADGSEQRQLTNDPASKGAPAVTPDGRYIVFVTNRSGSLQIWRMNIDGTNPIQLTDGEGKNFPAISPDGKWVFYNSTTDWHLWKLPIEGGDPTPLTRYVASHPGVSPDGKLIACMGGSEPKPELVILPSEGGAPLKRFDLAGWHSRVQWTVDGKAVVHVADRNGGGVLLKQSLDGSPAKEIASFGVDEAFDFGYSFDGRSLAVTRGAWLHDIVLISELK